MTKVPPMKCPHCGVQINKKHILQWAGKIRSKARLTFGTNRRSRKCPFCQKSGMSSRELQAHLVAECTERKRDPRGRKPVMKICRWCKQKMTTVEHLAHEPTCPSKPRR